MPFSTVNDLKNHLNLTDGEVEFDAELPRHLAAAREKVVAYVNRGVYETLPDDPADTDITVNDSINRAILEIAGYYFDAKGTVDKDMVDNMLEAFVGHLRMSSFA